MKQQVGIITLGTKNVYISKKFYVDGFGWKIVYEDKDTILFQMNGFVLSIWLQAAFEEDIQRVFSGQRAPFALAHNVDSPDKVQKVMNRLVEAGGKILRNADVPVHGGMRGYISDPDNHTWEIIWNPVWTINKNGSVIYKNRDLKN